LQVFGQGGLWSRDVARVLEAVNLQVKVWEVLLRHMIDILNRPDNVRWNLAFWHL
jgi:hypothetical protein